MSDTIFDHALFRPWAENPLKNRADVERALRDLALPVETYRSKGGARIRLDSAAAHFDQASADLEGFSRLLWGLAPATVGGANWIDWEPIARGLANGCDPKHPEYWGEPFDVSQRLVELAAIGFALRLVPEKIWEPLSEEQRGKVAAYLIAGHACRHADNNWKFFRLMVGMGLRHVGVDCDRGLDAEYIEELEKFHMGDGWYQDGNTRRADHYIPFAMHFYGLVLAALDGGEWTKVYRERASLIADDMTRWFADDGAALCFGRSMTYRFAIAGFFGATALAGDETMAWGQQKGFYLRNLRWWAERPFAARDDILAVGYTYPNLIMSEPYNSAQSPYWAFKAFLPLMLPESHPFWSSEEEACPSRPLPSIQRHAGFVIANPPGDAIALSCGQQTSSGNTFVRFGPEKYAKFAYSARYGFSIENDPWRFNNAVLDSMIGFSDDGVHFRVREDNEVALVADDLLYGLWKPFADVSVETWLHWDGDYQVRVHRIDTPRRLSTIEGGFAAARGESVDVDVGEGRAIVTTQDDISAVFDLSPGARRQGRGHVTAPNTNLVSAKTVVPQLIGELPAGITVLSIAVIAQRNGAVVRNALRQPPGMPDVEALVSRVSKAGIPVTLMRGLPN
jgi:hypothetical protein